MKFAPIPAILLLTACMTFLVPENGSAFLCGTMLVSIGDTKREVLEKCGEPDSVETWTEERPRWYPRRHYYKPYSWYDEPDKKHYKRPYRPVAVIRIEEWVYNFGSSRFIRYLRFENGKLKRIETGNYGY